MKCTTLFRQEGHRWLLFGEDAGRPQNIVDTNQVVVSNGDQAVLLDPGGMEVFAPTLAALTEVVPLSQVRHLFMSHQDPDVASSLALWREVCGADLEVHLSQLWTGFVTHFDRDAVFKPIADEGGVLTLGTLRLSFVPAHYLHSSGNFGLYDPVARILFSGDLGSALIPAAERRGVYVQDFNSHVRHMDHFHRRWMGSEAARNDWIDRVSRLEISMMVPQHGLVFKGDDVKRFLDWLSRLPLASALSGARSRVGI